MDPVTGEPIETQLYIYDPSAFDGDGAVAISAGNLDTADNVAVTVPGFGTDGESAPYHAERALTLYESTRYLDPGQTNASMFWIGYDAPDNPPWDGRRRLVRRAHRGRTPRTAASGSPTPSTACGPPATASRPT